jgi:hypothetical protein
MKNDEARYELKIPLTKFEYENIKKNFINNNIFLFKTFNDREVESLYFDDVNKKAFSDNLIGLSNRSKYRIRHYFNYNNPEIFFEIKEKKNKLTLKKRYKLKKNIFNYFYSNNLFFTKKAFRNREEFFNQKINFIIKRKKLFPEILIKYNRKYFSYKDIRITIDKNMKYKKILFSNNSQYLPMKAYAVLEIKAEQKFDYQMSEIINILDVKTKKYSKFTSGMCNYFDEFYL